MKRFNEWLALKLTQGVGSMACAYLFFIWALLPLAIPSLTQIVSYVSQSIIQLVLLSVIMVGQEIASRRTEQRAEQDHQAIMAELAEIRAMHKEIHNINVHMSQDISGQTHKIAEHLSHALRKQEMIR